MSNGLLPLSHKSTKRKQQVIKKRSFYGQIALQEQCHDKKAPKYIKGCKFYLCKIMKVNPIITKDDYFHMTSRNQDREQVEEGKVGNKHHHVIKGQSRQIQEPSKIKKNRQQRGYPFLQHV